MSGECKAAGEVVVGATAAQGGPDGQGSGAGEWGGTVHGTCLNCGAALNGNFCSACGQNAHVHRTLAALGHDIGHGVFHFEGKIWRTLPMLVLHPGALTRRYIAGERARFVSPMALFLFSVFLMFAIFHSVGGEIALPEGPIVLDPEGASVAADIGKNGVRRMPANAQSAANSTPGSEQRIIVSQNDLARGEAVGGAKEKSVGVPDDTLTNFKTGWRRVDDGVAKAAKNPSLMIYKMQTSAYKYSWALVPISVPFVALLFLWRRKFTFYDHAIFVAYSLGFMMLFVVMLSIAGAIGVPAGLIVVSALSVPVVHMFAQLRGAYALSKPSALWRAAALTIFSFLALATFTVLLLAMGLME
jgi:hypothetical protein